MTQYSTFDLQEEKTRLINDFDNIYNPLIHGHLEEAKERYINDITNACGKEDIMEILTIGLNNERLKGINKEFIKELIERYEKH